MEPTQQRGLVRRDENSRLLEPNVITLPAETDANTFNWEQAVRVLRKNRRFALIIAAGLTLLIAIVAFAIRDVYQPTARVEIDPSGTGIQTLHEIESSSELETPDYLETQSQVLQSDGLAISVIRKLHLDHNLELVGKRDISRFGAAPDAQAAALGPTSSDVFLHEAFALADRTPLESMALIKFRKHLSVNTIRNSRLIEIGYASEDAKLAQAVTNALVTEFIDQSYRNRYVTTMEASEWLSGRLTGLRDGMEKSTQAAEDYQNKFGLVEADDKDVPLAQLMGEVNHQLSEAQANRIEAEAYVKMIDLGQAEAVPAVRDDQLYQTLMTKYVDARAQMAQARTIYGDQNSNVKKLTDETSELAEQVEAERKRMVDRVRTAYKAAVAREAMMAQARQKVLSQMGDASSHMVAYHILKNEALASADLYNTLQARLKEAGIYAGLRSSNIRIVDLAPQLTKPTGPHRDLIIAIGALVSCMLALALAFVRESFDNTVRTPDDVRSWVALPSLGMLPTMSIASAAERPERRLLSVISSSQSTSGTFKHSVPQIIPMQSHSPEAEAISNLRTALAFSSSPRPHQIFLISSSSSGEGKSTVAINLAIAFSQRGSTCLVDGDLRNPAVASAFGLESVKGLGDVLTGRDTLEQAVTPVEGFPSLKVLAGGTAAPNAADLISSEKMDATLKALKQEFEFVIVDSPPVIPFSDARSLAAHSDAVILVGRYGLTTRRALTRSAQLLRDMHAPVLGVVLNDIDLNSPDYHYYNYGFSRTNRDGRYYERADSSPKPPSLDRPNAKGAHA
jgi:succinoglycan biosynthesis transport protein ExoP